MGKILISLFKVPSRRSTRAKSQVDHSDPYSQLKPKGKKEKKKKKRQEKSKGKWKSMNQDKPFISTKVDGACVIRIQGAGW